MKLKTSSLAVIILVTAAGFFSCNKDDCNSIKPVTSVLGLPETPYQYNSSFGSNQLATLGRVLFYDNHLSVNNSIACASCHKQSLAFSDSKNLSSGFGNQLTKRNSLPIQNLGSNSFSFGIAFNSVALFWDGREKFLSTMVLKPIVNHVEMGMGDLTSIVNKVKGAPYYNQLFMDAFNSSDVDIDKIARALSSFVSSISSSNTRFDNSNRGITQLNALETQGKALFFDTYNCNSCHQTQVITGGYQQGGGNGTEVGFVNIGLDVNYSDNGLGALNGNSADNGRFKIPSLRNISLTGPYMHDGRFGTLDQVLEHYSHNIKNHPNLDTRLKGTNSLPKEMNISAQDKTALIAFLNSLTDFSMITDPKFSNPFKIQ